MASKIHEPFDVLLRSIDASNNKYPDGKKNKNGKSIGCRRTFRCSNG